MIQILLAAIVGLYGLEMLDQTDQEWVAPSHRIEETLINPFDYVESISESIPSIACHVFFLQIEDNDIWRLIIVGKDKLVVLQEDLVSQIEMNLPFDAVGAVFSRNGRFVIVREGTYTDDQAVLVNIDSGEISYFDPTPDNIRCGLSVADDGTVIGIGDNFLIDFSPDLTSVEIREYANFYFRNIGTSANSEIIILENVINRPREIMAFDWDGRHLWTIDIGDRTIVDPIVVSLDGAFAAASFTSDGIMLLDGTTGTIMTEQFTGCQSSCVSISQDGSQLAIPTALCADGRPDNMIIGVSNELLQSSTREEYQPQAGWAYTPTDINNNGDCLFSVSRTGPPGDSRLCLINDNGELIWCSAIQTSTLSSLT